MKVIAFEGIDGCGKSTQARLLHESLVDQGAVNVTLYQYTGKDNYWGRRIRDVYALDSVHMLKPLRRFRAMQELLYSLCARSNLRKLHPNDGSLVIADRSIVTAYASHIGRLPEWYITFLEPKLIPDVVVFLDVDPEVGLSRIANRETMFLDEDLESAWEFRSNYQSLESGNLPRILKTAEFITIDASRSIERVHKETLRLLTSHFAWPCSAS